MNNFLKNKRVLFALIMCFIVIAIAIVIFIIIGAEGKKSENVSVISLDNSTGNSMTNVTNTVPDDNEIDTNTTDNTASNNNTSNNNTSRRDNDGDNDNDDNDNDNDDNDDNEDDEIDFDGDKFYLDAVNDFIAGLKDKKKMEKFIDNHLDVKAYAACYNVNGSDSEFLNEYTSLKDDDKIVKNVSKKLPEIAKYNDVKLLALTDPKKSGDSDEINRVILTIKADGKTEKLRMVFYGDTVIYIYDDNNKSIVDLD